MKQISHHYSFRPERTQLAALVLGGMLIASAPGCGREAGVAPGASIPTPEQFFGFQMGTERKLAPLEKIYEYFAEVDKSSDRVVVREYGKTTMGKPMILAIVSSPDTIANLPVQQQMQKKLGDPRTTSEEEAERLVRDTKAILLIETAQHSNEVSSHVMAIKLIHKLATESSSWIDHVLKNVIVLMIPIGNPDGHKMIVDWHGKNLGTPFEGSPLPELWHKYIGHDNNRENYMQTQVETKNLNRLLFEEWLPDVYVNVHNQGSQNTRIFVPPYDVPNANIDPLIWSEVSLYGHAMAAKLHQAGKTGVMWGERYTAFQEGTNMRAPLWRNAIGLLTETAASPWGMTIVQEIAKVEGPSKPGTQFVPPANTASSGERSPIIALPPPTDVNYRMTYPRPWVGGTWTLADAVDYQFVSTVGLIEAVADTRERRKRNFYVLNKRTIERYEKGSPYAFLVPPDQHDAVAAAKLLQVLQAGGAEVHRAETTFTADGREYPARTHAVLLAQPFGRWVKNLLEVQEWPEHVLPSIRAGGRGVAWTLGMLMGVETVQIEHPFEARLTLVKTDVEAPPGKVSGSGPTFVLSHAVNNSLVAMNRFFKAGAEVSWARDELELSGRRYAPGAILVTGASRATVATIAQELRLDVESTSQPVSPSALKLRPPRIAIYEPWSGGNAESAMDAGWTRWLLEQHEFPYTHARNVDLRKPDLIGRFDVVIIPQMSSEELISGRHRRSIIDSPSARVRPEYDGGIGEEGVRHLREFVQNGGTVITLGDSAQFAVEHLDVPLRNVVEGLAETAFLCPGSLLRISIDTRHPIGYGMPNEADAMFLRNGAYVPAGARSAGRTTMVARYPEGRLLRSGVLIGGDKLRGAGAVVEVAMGKGHVILFPFRVQHRAQTWGTFKLLFNSIFYGPAMAARPAAGTSEAAVRR